MQRETTQSVSRARVGDKSSSTESNSDVEDSDKEEKNDHELTPKSNASEEHIFKKIPESSTSMTVSPFNPLLHNFGNVSGPNQQMNLQYPVQFKQYNNILQLPYPMGVPSILLPNGFILPVYSNQHVQNFVPTYNQLEPQEGHPLAVDANIELRNHLLAQAQSTDGFRFHQNSDDYERHLVIGDVNDKCNSTSGAKRQKLGHTGKFNSSPLEESTPGKQQMKTSVFLARKSASFDDAKRSLHCRQVSSNVETDTEPSIETNKSDNKLRKLSEIASFFCKQEVKPKKLVVKESEKRIKSEIETKDYLCVDGLKKDSTSNFNRSKVVSASSELSKCVLCTKKHIECRFEGNSKVCFNCRKAKKKCLRISL